MKTALPRPTPWPAPRTAVAVPARPEPGATWVARGIAWIGRWTPAPLLNCGGWTP